MRRVIDLTQVFRRLEVEFSRLGSGTSDYGDLVRSVSRAVIVSQCAHIV